MESQRKSLLNQQKIVDKVYIVYYNVYINNRKERTMSKKHKKHKSHKCDKCKKCDMQVKIMYINLAIALLNLASIIITLVLTIIKLVG